MSFANLEVRQEIAKKRLKHYEVAQSLGISPYTLSVWLRTEMDKDKKKKVLKAIHDYK